MIPPRSDNTLDSKAKAIFTTSWDDGHPLDARMAELLSRHGFQGTFYIPLSNREGLPVMRPQDMQLLSQRFEIGSHTMDHCYLDTVGPAEARRQIVEGKTEIEQILGHAVSGFCYPGGHHKLEHRQMVAQAGFDYARTVASLYRTLRPDPFSMPITVQYYPHTRNLCVKHFFSVGDWGQRKALFCVSLGSGDFASRLRALLDYVCLHGGVFHLWGHSWELGAFDGWRQLDSFLRYAAALIPVKHRLTNRDVIRQAAGRRLVNPPSSQVDSDTRP